MHRYLVSRSFSIFSREIDDVEEKRMYSHDKKISPAQTGDHHTLSRSGTP